MLASTSPWSGSAAPDAVDHDHLHALLGTSRLDLHLLRRAAARYAGLRRRGTAARLRAEFPGVSRSVITEAILQARVLCAAVGFYSTHAVERLARARLSGRAPDARIALGRPPKPQLDIPPPTAFRRARPGSYQQRNFVRLQRSPTDPRPFPPP